MERYLVGHLTADPASRHGLAPQVDHQRLAVLHASEGFVDMTKHLSPCRRIIGDKHRHPEGPLLQTVLIAVVGHDSADLVAPAQVHLPPGVIGEDRVEAVASVPDPIHGPGSVVPGRGAHYLATRVDHLLEHAALAVDVGQHLGGNPLGHRGTVGQGAGRSDKGDDCQKMAHESTSADGCGCVP